jgi:beige protein homolog 1
MAHAWEAFVVTENKTSEEATKTRMSKRKEKLKLLMSQDASVTQALARNEIILGQWQANIHDIEHVRFLKTVQDTADHAVFVESTWNRLLRQITRERAILDPHANRRWRLDMTEGRSRMRKKLMPDIRVRSEDYQPKGSTITPPVPTVQAKSPSFTAPIDMDVEDGDESQSGAEELDFEVVDPDESSTIEEDKNRKVLRSLEHGDTVVDVFNVSRIVGLDAHGQPIQMLLTIRRPPHPWEGEYISHRSLLSTFGSRDCGCMGRADRRTRSFHSNSSGSRRFYSSRHAIK